MKRYVIEGGKPLQGCVGVHGSKNAVLPILAATAMNGGISVIENVPDIQDVRGMLAILEELGAKCSFDDSMLVVNSQPLDKCRIEKMLADKIRTSILFCGALLARYGEVQVAPPGGCAIGSRPIDIHLDAFRKMGVEICWRDGLLGLSAKKLTGIEYHMPFPSVGATQNLMMAAIGAEGTTVIHDPAMEPEILEFQEFLNNIGARVEGAGSKRIVIRGKTGLTDGTYVLKGDRIVAGTYMVGCALAGGEIRLEQIRSDWCRSYADILQKMGCTAQYGKDYVQISAKRKLQSPGLVATAPYPGFPTDMQPQFMSLLAQVPGESMLRETIFENRFHNAQELQKLGADIAVNGNTAVIHGRKFREGKELISHDLRGGAALVLAGLGIEGVTSVSDEGYIDRGYENIRRDLCMLGAKVT